MISQGISTAVVALAASALVSAQTSTVCNPLEKTCPPDPAFGAPPANCDFTAGACGVFHELDGTGLTYDGNGADFKIVAESNAPTIMTNKYIFFGRLDVEVQAAAGQGIVTSCVLQSDDLDEIDWEWVGGDNAQAQSNYFSKGDTTTYDRGAFHPVDNPLGSFHTYSVEWTSAAINWIIDGATVRTLTWDDAHGGTTFPQTPMQVKLGTWVGGRRDAPKGTVQWAGGYADWSQAPFNAYYKSVAITDYAGGDGPTADSIKQYVYGDNSGTYQSIQIEKGDGSVGGSDPKPHPKPDPKPSESAKPTEHTDKPAPTKDHSKTAEPSSTEVSSTMKTATPTGHKNSTTTAASTTAAKTSGGSPTTAAPSTVTSDQGGDAGRQAVSFAGIALAGVGVALAQLVL